MIWLLWPLKKGQGSWHIWSHETSRQWQVMLCGKGLAPERSAEVTDKPLPDGRTCEVCLRIKASREGRA